MNRISWNFQELFTTWCHTAPLILSFYSNAFGVSQSKTRTLPYKTWGSGGYHFVSIAHSISSLCLELIRPSISMLHFFNVSAQCLLFQWTILVSLWWILTHAGWSESFMVIVTRWLVCRLVLMHDGWSRHPWIALWGSGTCPLGGTCNRITEESVLCIISYKLI